MSAIYWEHWGLARSPFAASATGPAFYEGESQKEALARLRFVVRHSRSALVLGPRGVGKSTVLGRFAAQCRREGVELATVRLIGLSSRELLWQLAGEFSLSPRPGDDAVALFRRLADFAAASQWRNGRAVVLVDDADQAGPDARLQLERVVKLGGGASWLTLVQAVGSGGTQRLGQQLLESADLRIDVDPWSEAETVDYVQHSLLEAGGERPVFDDEAISVLFTLSEGLPRAVNRLADHALLAAAANGLEMVDAATMEAAHEALAWAAPA